jgi:DNA polymerase IV (DinB-like DNA polymerase)
MNEARLPGTTVQTQSRIVAHVDMDCFYAACERLREPALEDEPLVVGMGFEPGSTTGAVATASYEAREYGVESAMAITEALERLPRKIDAVEDPETDVDAAGFYRPVDLSYYESISNEVKGILRDQADVVREISVDEACLDITDRVTWEEATRWGRDLKATIGETVGVTASIGIAPTMSAAKIASDRDKPDGLVVVRPGDVQAFLADLPVEDVHLVGPVTAAALKDMDIETAGDIASADPEALAAEFGDRGTAIYRYARGEDNREVTPRGRPKSLSRESSLQAAPGDSPAVQERVETLAQSVAERAQSKDALYQTIGIKVVESPFDVNTRARSLPGPIADPALVETVASELLTEFEDAKVRKVGVRLSNLSFGENQQADLHGWDPETEATPRDGESSDGGQANREPEAEPTAQSSSQTTFVGQTKLSDF